MLIYKGRTGFCKGVQRAIDKALESKKDRKTIYTLGNIIHNQRVVRGLEGIGILPIYDLKGLNHKDLIVICSHGTTKKIIDSLNEKGVVVVDGTCPFVKNIHNKVYEYSQNGYEIVIIGDPEHTEVKGIAGWCMGDYQIIQSENQIDLCRADKYLVVCQTTFPVKKYFIIKKIIKKLGDKLGKIVVFFDSICYTTEVRQKEASIIADKSDLVLILGDISSSNTNKLVQVAKEKCANTHLISKVSDLDSVLIKNISKLGIVSGASTPEELVTEVINRMSEAINNDNLTIEEVKTVEVTNEETKKKTKEKEISMSEGLKKYAPKSYRTGMRLKAKVVSADYNGILVALESLGKNDTGFIDRDEVELDKEYNPENYKTDDILDVVIIPKKDKNQKFINLSKKAYDELKIDDEKVKGILAGDEFTLECNQEVKGGLLGKIGTYTVFVPASQIRLGYVKNLSDYLNKPLRLKALPPKEELDEDGKPKRSRNPKRIVASQRIVLEEERAQKEEEFWNSVPEGAIVKGKVKRFASFGAFVSLKHMDALVHNSELSWSRKKINSPDEVLELNKTYEFQVLSVDRENRKISLGYKQLQPKPEEIALTKYPVGTVTKGKVVRLINFGAFVELEPGIDGLVHISQINHGCLKTAKEALKEGDEVEVKVMAIEEGRITLSMKELIPEEEIPEMAQIERMELEEGEKTDRIAQFKKRLDAQDNTSKPKRKIKEEESPREYISSSSVVSLAEFFKNAQEENKE